MKFACPSCDARLRLPETFAGERRITCPHCRCDFLLPGEEGDARSLAVDRPTSLRRAEALDERRGSFRRRKRYKAKKSMNPMLIVIPVVAGVMILVGSVCLAVVYVRSRAQDDVAAAIPTETSRQERPIQNPPIRTNPDPRFAQAKIIGERARPLIEQQPRAEPPQEAPSPPLLERAKPASPPTAKPTPLPPADPVEGTEVGNRAPEIKGQDIDRKAFKLSDYKGKVVLLDFWGYW